MASCSIDQGIARNKHSPCITIPTLLIAIIVVIVTVIIILLLVRIRTIRITYSVPARKP